MKVGIYSISTPLIKQFWGKGADIKGNYKVLDGFPQYARLIDVKFRAETDTTDFLVEHKSFPELAEATYLWDAPRREITTARFSDEPSA